MLEAGLSLGSNLGDRQAVIREAIASLEPQFRVRRMSRLYETAPWGKTDQGAFLNACVIGETDCPPLDLLRHIKAIEARLGRRTTERWGPRIIDIDILFRGDETYQDDVLSIPHRDLFNRAFVLVPLVEIAPDLTIGGRSIASALAALPRSPGDVTPIG